MLQKVLPRCVLAGPGEPKSAPRPGQAFPRAFGSGGARSPIHDSAATEWSASFRPDDPVPDAHDYAQRTQMATVAF